VDTDTDADIGINIKHQTTKSYNSSRSSLSSKDGKSEKNKDIEKKQGGINLEHGAHTTNSTQHRGKTKTKMESRKKKIERITVFGCRVVCCITS
jgi:hypothetical protein